MSAVPAIPLTYARPGLRNQPMRATHWGTAGCVLAGITAIYTVVCVLGMFHAKGWDAIGWVIVGVYGNWIGAGVAFLLGIIGCFRKQRLRARAVMAMAASVAVAGAPFAVVYLVMWCTGRT